MSDDAQLQYAEAVLAVEGYPRLYTFARKFLNAIASASASHARVGSLHSFLSPVRPLSMRISESDAGGLPTSAPRGAAGIPAVSDGTAIAGNEASAAVPARLRSLSSPRIHSDASSARSRCTAACSGSSRQSLASPLYRSGSDGEGISNVPGVHAMIHGSTTVGSGPARPAVRRSTRGLVPC